MSTKHTFVAMETRTAKVWTRNGKRYYRSPFPPFKVKQVGKDDYVKFTDYAIGPIQKRK